MGSTNNTYLIVGAGCFGASTALAIKKSKPDAEVTLLDRTPYPCPLAAAHDLNKIIRPEYEDIFYMELALEAQEEWRTDPALKSYYHETGVVRACRESVGQKYINNYEHLLGKGNSPAALLDVNDAKVRFDGIFRDGNLTNVTNFTWNPYAGWGDAANALRTVIEAAIGLGVNYVQATAAKVDLQPDGACSGVVTDAGEQFKAEHIILCTGAQTAWLLAESAPDRPEIHVGDRMVAAAAVMCAYQQPDNQTSKFSSAPVIVHALGDYPAECIPPGDKGLVKCTHELSFSNYTFHKASNTHISVPPPQRTRNTWSQDVPQGLQDESAAVRTKLFGSWVEDMVPYEYRMCWDAITPNQDWIISPHPHVSHLYIVSGGSFHAWKFLPTIGKYVIQMIQGELKPEQAARWGWDSTRPPKNYPYFPRRDLKDIKGYS